MKREDVQMIVPTTVNAMNQESANVISVSSGKIVPYKNVQVIVIQMEFVTIQKEHVNVTLSLKELLVKRKNAKIIAQITESALLMVNVSVKLDLLEKIVTQSFARMIVTVNNFLIFRKRTMFRRKMFLYSRICW